MSGLGVWFGSGVRNINNNIIGRGAAALFGVCAKNSVITPVPFFYLLLISRTLLAGLVWCCELGVSNIDIAVKDILTKGMVFA